jgi:hypothetical protein
MRSRRLWLVWALCAALSPSLARSQDHGVLDAIERTGRRLGQTRMAERETAVIDRGTFAVWVRPAARVIGVSRGLSQHGFFLDRDGRLPAAERARLGEMIQHNAPGATAGTVRRNVISEIQRFKTHERALRRQDPVIRDVLHRASGARTERTVWRGRRGSLQYRPQANVLAGVAPLSRQGFFLSRTARGLEVEPRDLDGLRQFLHSRR